MRLRDCGCRPSPLPATRREGYGSSQRSLRIFGAAALPLAAADVRATPAPNLPCQ